MDALLQNIRNALPSNLDSGITIQKVEQCLQTSLSALQEVKDDEKCVLLLKSGIMYLIKILNLLSRSLHSAPANSLLDLLLENIMVASDCGKNSNSFVVLFITEQYVDVLLSTNFPFSEKLEVLKSMNFIFESATSTVKEKILQTHSFKSKLNNIFHLIFSIGDFEFQVGVIEFLFRLVPRKMRKEWCQQFITEDEILNEFLKIRDSCFEIDCRKFLNQLNISHTAETKVVSCPCFQIAVGSHELNKPTDVGYDQFWIDFNIGSKRIIVFCENAPFSSQSSSTEGFWDTFSLWHTDINNFHCTEEKGMTHAYIQLKSSARCFPSTLQKDSPPVVHICVDKKYELENLLTKTLDQKKVSDIAKPLHIVQEVASEEPLGPQDGEESKVVANTYLQMQYKKVSVPSELMSTPASTITINSVCSALKKKEVDNKDATKQTSTSNMSKREINTTCSQVADKSSSTVTDKSVSTPQARATRSRKRVKTPVVTIHKPVCSRNTRLKTAVQKTAGKASAIDEDSSPQDIVIPDSMPTQPQTTIEETDKSNFIKQTRTRNIVNKVNQDVDVQQQTVASDLLKTKPLGMHTSEENNCSKGIKVDSSSASFPAKMQKKKTKRNYPSKKNDSQVSFQTSDKTKSMQSLANVSAKDKAHTKFSDMHSEELYESSDNNDHIASSIEEFKSTNLKKKSHSISASKLSQKRKSEKLAPNKISTVIGEDLCAVIPNNLTDDDKTKLVDQDCKTNDEKPQSLTVNGKIGSLSKNNISKELHKAVCREIPNTNITVSDQERDDQTTIIKRNSRKREKEREIFNEENLLTNSPRLSDSGSSMCKLLNIKSSSGEKANKIETSTSMKKAINDHLDDYDNTDYRFDTEPESAPGTQQKCHMKRSHDNSLTSRTLNDLTSVDILESKFESKNGKDSTKFFMNLRERQPKSYTEINDSPEELADINNKFPKMSKISKSDVSSVTDKKMVITRAEQSSSDFDKITMQKTFTVSLMSVSETTHDKGRLSKDPYKFEDHEPATDEDGSVKQKSINHSEGDVIVKTHSAIQAHSVSALKERYPAKESFSWEYFVREQEKMKEKRPIIISESSIAQNVVAQSSLLKPGREQEKIKQGKNKIKENVLSLSNLLTTQTSKSPSAWSAEKWSMTGKDKRKPQMLTSLNTSVCSNSDSQEYHSPMIFCSQKKPKRTSSAGKCNPTKSNNKCKSSKSKRQRKKSKQVKKAEEKEKKKRTNTAPTDADSLIGLSDIDDAISIGRKSEVSWITKYASKSEIDCKTKKTYNCIHKHSSRTFSPHNSLGHAFAWEMEKSPDIKLVEARPVHPAARAKSKSKKMYSPLNVALVTPKVPAGLSKDLSHIQDQSSKASKKKEYSDTSIENLSKANLPAKSSFLEWQSKTSESPSSKKNTSTCTRQKTTALTQEVTRHQVGSDDDDEVSVSRYVSGLFSGPSSLTRASKSELKRKYSEIIDSEDDRRQSNKKPCLVPRKLFYDNYNKKDDDDDDDDSDEEEEDVDDADNTLSEQKALKTAKENTFLTKHSETTILRHINKTGPVKFPSGDRENVVLKEPSTSSTESLSQPELEMEDPEISNMAFNSVSVLLRGFGVDLQKHLKDKEHQIQELAQNALQLSKKHMNQIWISDRKKWEKFIQNFQEKIYKELSALDKDISDLMEAEEKTEALYMQQIKVIKDCREKLQKRVLGVKNCHQDLKADAEKKVLGELQEQKYVQNQLKKELKSLQNKFLLEMQQQQLQSVRMSLQKLFQ